MTPVLSDGLDAFVFTFSFFGLRTSRFDFCCLAIGWVTSIAGRPALGNGTAVCPCGPATGMVDQAGTAPDRLCGFWCDVCRKRRDLDIATVERECNGSLLGAQAGPLIFAGAISGMTMKLVEGRVVRALASRRDVKKTPLPGLPEEGLDASVSVGSAYLRGRSCSFEAPGFFCSVFVCGLPSCGLFAGCGFCGVAMSFTHSSNAASRAILCAGETGSWACLCGPRRRHVDAGRDNAACGFSGGIPPAALIRYLRNWRRKQWGLKPRPGEIFDRISARPKAGQSGR